MKLYKRYLTIFLLVIFLTACSNSAKQVIVNYGSKPTERLQKTTKVSVDIVPFKDSNVEENIVNLLEKDKGPIMSADMKKLKDLKSLELYGDTNSIQDVIKYFPRLKQLKIDNYTGSDDICSKLSDFKELKSLYLKNYEENLNIDGLAKITTLKELTLDVGTINFSNNKILSQSSIEAVELDNVNKCDLNFIANIPSVKQVILSICQISDYSAVTNLTRLNKLCIEYNWNTQKADGLASFRGIKENGRIKYIGIKKDEFLSGYLLIKSDTNSFEIFGVVKKPEKLDSEVSYDQRYLTILIGDNKSNSKPLHIIKHKTGDDEYSGHPADFEDIFYSTDVNFDGYNDILILNGYYGNQVGTYYTCWLWNNKINSFIKNDSFSWIMNVSIDKKNSMILSSWRNWAASHSWAMYKYIKGKYVMVSRLTEEAIDDEKLKEGQEKWQYTDERLVGGEMKIHEQFLQISPTNGPDKADMFFKPGSYWELYGDKWRQLDNNGLMTDFSIYDR